MAEVGWLAGCIDALSTQEWAVVSKASSSGGLRMRVVQGLIGSGRFPRTRCGPS